ncbi:MAG: hypothetical protein WA941_16825 [Nitrososphaeraceae archaeon]
MSSTSYTEEKDDIPIGGTIKSQDVITYVIQPRIYIERSELTIASIQDMRNTLKPL